MSPLTRYLTVVAALSAVVSCGGGQTRSSLFSLDWEDDGGASIGRVWQRIGSVPIPQSASIVVGVAGHADKLVGEALGGGSRWTFAHPLDSRPVVTGNVVVGSGENEAFALDAATGKVLWRRPTGGIPLLGAGDDGTVTVITFRKAGGVGSVLLAVAHDGSVVRQIETDKPLGAPAVLGRLAFVPWAGQYISVIDLANGDESARVTLREETSRAFTEGGSLWFGHLQYIRFDDHIRNASRGGATQVSVPARELPGSPKLMPPADHPPSPVADATDKARMYSRPRGTDSGAVIEDDRFYDTYFRVAMGFDAHHGKLAWVNLHDSDFIGGAAGEGVVVLCDERGKLVELDAKTGAVVGELDLGEPIQSCVVNVDTWRAGGTAVNARPLEEQLSEVVRTNDPQLVVVQKLLLRELATSTDETATRTLLELANDPQTSPDLLDDARAALANRRQGATYLEAALSRHYDFLKDVLRPPPVGPIAQALGGMKDKSAAPLLASHLFDPADTDDDVKQAAAALAVVAGPAELPALRRFFGMYRASAANDDIADAVVSVGQTLLALGDTALVVAASRETSTVPRARDRLAALASSLPEKSPTEPSGKKSK